MAVFEDALKGPSLWVGVGLAVAAPIVLPVVGAVARPLAKTAIKGYLAAVDTLAPMVGMATAYVGDVLSGVREQVGAVVAEARQEYESGGAVASVGPEAKPEKPRRPGKESKDEPAAAPSG